MVIDAGKSDNATELYRVADRYTPNLEKYPLII